MKLVYFGSDVFLSCFEYFAAKHDISALYTYHNNEDYFTEYAITARARQLGIPVHYESVTPQHIAHFFREEGCEIIFSAEYDRRLPIPEDLPEFRGINVHSSLLPQGRSYYPIEAAMQRDLPHSGVTLHKLAPRLDCGDILMQREVTIMPDMDSVDVYMRCAAYAREMLEKIMTDFEAHWANAMPQIRQLPYWYRPDDALLTLTHDMSRAEALSVFRKYNSMTQLLVSDRWYYVTDMAAGTAFPESNERFLSEMRMLYRVRDGHLRLHIHPKEEGK